MKKKSKVSLTRLADGTNYLIPFGLISVLFLMWGFAHGLLDVLDKHFQDILHVTKAQSGFVQFSLYIGYLVMAVPAGLVIKKYGYKRGIILGLTLFALGAFLFYPVAKLESFVPFLIALFVIACGLACLETSANPYSTVLGPKAFAARRINISQSFNGLGWILGPLMGGLFIFGADKAQESDKYASMVTPYMVLGCIVVVLLLVFLFLRLPEIEPTSATEQTEDPPMSHLLRHPAFLMAVVAEFLYVAAQTGVNSFFINYVTEAVPHLQEPVQKAMSHLGWFGSVFTPKNHEQAASLILAIGGMGLFWVGRLLGSYFMKFVAPQILLMLYGIINAALIAIVIAGLGWWSVVALFTTYFFMSIMFPTIFALGLKDLGPLTKKGASFLVMAVAGGAFCPPMMGAIGDHYGMAVAFIIPLLCFVFIGWYGSKRSGKAELSRDKNIVLEYHH
ncbi:MULTISPECIES: L-fucose:H+ symporter permease [Chitinophagaceae]